MRAVHQRLTPSREHSLPLNRCLHRRNHPCLGHLIFCRPSAPPQPFAPRATPFLERLVKPRQTAEERAAAGAEAEYHHHVETFVKETSRRLDAIEKDIEEWGHGSFSGLELIPLPTGQEHEPLKSGANRDYSTILADVNNSVQGGASLLDSSALGLGLGLGVKIDPLGTPSQLLSQSQNIIARERLENASKEEAEVAALLHQQRVEIEKQKLANLQEGAAEHALPATPPAAGATNPLFSTPVGSLPNPTAQPATPPAGTQPTSALVTAVPDLSRITNPTIVNSAGSTIAFPPPQGLTTATLAQTVAKSRTISPAEAAAQAKSIAIQERITDIIAHPVAISGNRALYMGLAQVSVSPGWRTREGYACEVSVRPELVDSGGAEHTSGKSTRDVSGGGDSNGGVRHVSIFGMFPQARSQTLDLAYSKRQQFQLLMNLAIQYAAVGQEANGKAVLDYVKRLEKDVDTRSSLPVLVPNTDGVQVTYRFDPSLQALGDPSANKSKPANLLHATSVPVLLALSCDKDDIGPNTSMRLRMTTRWMPLEKRHWAKKSLVDWWYRAAPPLDARYSNAKILNNAKALDEVVALMYQYHDNGVLGSSGDLRNENLRNAVVARYRILEPRVSGNIITRSMAQPWKEKEKQPTPKVPAIVNLSPPGVLETNTSPQFALRLQNFGDAPVAAAFKAYLDGQEADAANIIYSGGTDGILRARFNNIPRIPPGSVDLLVIRTDTSASAAIRVQVIPLVPPPPTPPALNVTAITPQTGHLYATNTFVVTGTGFAKPDKTSAMKAVFADNRDCTIEYISPTLLKVKVPPLRAKPAAPPAGTTPPNPTSVVTTLTFVNEAEVHANNIPLTLAPSEVVDSK